MARQLPAGWRWVMAIGAKYNQVIILWPLKLIGSLPCTTLMDAGKKRGHESESVTSDEEGGWKLYDGDSGTDWYRDVREKIDKEKER